MYVWCHAIFKMFTTGYSTIRGPFLRKITNTKSIPKFQVETVNKRYTKTVYYIEETRSQRSKFFTPDYLHKVFQHNSFDLIYIT